MLNPSDKPRVILKKKNIQVVIDHCIENNVEFSVKHKPFPDDEWEVEVNITTIHKAILFGMFLREARLTIVGAEPVVPVVAKPKKAAPVKKEEVQVPVENEEVEEQEDKPFDDTDTKLLF